MSLHTAEMEPIPELTRRLAKGSFPKGTLAMRLRDHLGTIYQEEDFADLFAHRGRGGYDPRRLALVLVLQALENLSDVQAAEMVRGRLDWKYALALEPDDTGFDASVLTYFRERLVQAGAQERILDPLLRVCREQGLLKEAGKQRLDSTMVLANARRLSSLESLGETVRMALNTWAESEPEWVLGVVDEGWFDRYVHRFELARFPKEKSQQEALKEQVGKDAWNLIQAARAPQAPETLQGDPLVQMLERIWMQHFEWKEGAIRWRDGPSVCNGERIVNPYDPQARESRKRDTDWLGYKLHVMETSDENEPVHLVTQVAVTQATEGDQEKMHHLQPSPGSMAPRVQELEVDSGYVTGENLVDLADDDIQVIGPVLPDTSWQAKQGYGRDQFQVDWQEHEATCPAGAKSQAWIPHEDPRGYGTIQVRFAAQTCQVCPVKVLCTTSKKGGRTITLHGRQEVEEALQQRRRDQRTPEFLTRYARRSGIEGTIAQAVKMGMRHARSRGKDTIFLQASCIAAAINVARLNDYFVRTQVGLPPRRTRTPSPFARLRPVKAA